MTIENLANLRSMRYGDPERSQLRADLHKRNRAYLDALYDVRADKAAREAAKNAD